MLVESLGFDPQKVTPNRHSAPPDQTLLRTEVAWRQDGATFLHKQKSLFVTQKFKEPTRQLVILVVVIVDFWCGLLVVHLRILNLSYLMF